MRSTTPKKVENILRRYAMQLKKQPEPISTSQAATLSRLASSVERLCRGDGVASDVDFLQNGQPDFTESLLR